MRDKILKAVVDGCAAIEQLQQPHALAFIDQVSRTIATTFQQGGKLLVAGNGGSLCDAMHFAEEFTGQFRGHRRALPAIALTDPGHLTCIANDHGYERVFARSIEAFGQPGDLFVGLTTSGNSPNMVEAFQTARGLGLTTIAFLGKGGGKLKGVANYELVIDHFPTSDRIQEAHMTAMHVIIEMVEGLLFGCD